VPKQTFAPDESAEFMLKVTDAEVPVERVRRPVPTASAVAAVLTRPVLQFVSPAERARLEEEQRREAERLARARGDDIGERGLQTMMGGKLETQCVVSCAGPAAARALTRAAGRTRSPCCRRLCGRRS
jgi:hypothetical protein